MQTLQAVLLAVGTVAVVAVTVAFIVLVRNVTGQISKLGRAGEDLSHFLRTTEEEIAGLTHDARSTLGDVDRLVSGVTGTVYRIDRVAAGAERLLDGVQVASAAAKAVKSSTAGLWSVYEGVKQGIKVLRGSQEK